MTFEQKCDCLRLAVCEMNSSKELCMEDAISLRKQGKIEYSDWRLEKAAQYAWGFTRPLGWIEQ